MEEDAIKILEFLFGNLFVGIGGKLFQQTVGNEMGTYSASLLVALVLYLYETELEP